MSPSITDDGMANNIIFALIKTDTEKIVGSRSAYLKYFNLAIRAGEESNAKW